MGHGMPLVSVVTPVHNGEKHLADCIESVLAQTYANWEYVIVNNCSADRSREIARSYAERDTRIRIHDNDRFLDIIPNWNHALHQISPHAAYVKVLHADDALFPECLERMVGVAERYPQVGMVGAYVLQATRVMCDGLPYPGDVFSGHDLCRATLREDLYVFGTPSSTLIRADLVRALESFYREDYLHADLAACYELLKHWDFGYVHQVLTNTRLHSGSMTEAVANRLDTQLVERLCMLLEYGPWYFSDQAFRYVRRRQLVRYYRTLARHWLRRRPKGLLAYQHQRLRRAGYRFNPTAFIAACLWEAADTLLNPKSAIGRLVRGREGRERVAVHPLKSVNGSAREVLSPLADGAPALTGGQGSVMVDKAQVAKTSRHV